jgi:hypothetical protein
MDDDVPLAIVGAELERIPPVRVEGAVREAGDLGPQVEPAVKEAEETHDQEQNRRKHQVAYCDAQSLEIQVPLQIFDLVFDPGLVEDKG